MLKLINKMQGLKVLALYFIPFYVSLYLFSSMFSISIPFLSLYFILMKDQMHGNPK